MSNIINVADRFRPRPKPETLNSILMCEKCIKPTEHEFLKAEEILSTAFTSRSFTYIYQCKCCKTQRVWGSVVEKIK